MSLVFKSTFWLGERLRLTFKAYSAFLALLIAWHIELNVGTCPLLRCSATLSTEPKADDSRFLRSALRWTTKVSSSRGSSVISCLLETSIATPSPAEKLSGFSRLANPVLRLDFSAWPRCLSLLTRLYQAELENLNIWMLWRPVLGRDKAGESTVLFGVDFPAIIAYLDLILLTCSVKPGRDLPYTETLRQEEFLRHLKNV